MKCCKLFFTTVLLFISCHCFCQNTLKLDGQENENLQTFIKLKKYIVSSIDMQTDVLDTINIKHILLNYVFSESTLDTLDKTHFKENEISEKKLKEFVKEFGSFYQYFFERRKFNVAQHLAAIPIRLSSDKCIYKKLIPFQKQNTFIYFDDRYPRKILGYILFIPKSTNKSPVPKICSWVLQFDAGYWAFKSPMGTVGLEYFLSNGIEAPKDPIGK